MVDYTREEAERYGMPSLRITTYSRRGDRAKVLRDTCTGIADALTRPLTEEEKSAGTVTPEIPPRIALTGTYDEIQDFFVGELGRSETVAPYARWTDGLPIVPPTEEKVAEMLKGTSHAPDEVFPKPMMPSKWQFTVEKVAINGVMAGCKPEYMPVLLAMAEAMSDEFTGGRYISTGGFGFMSVVSGPIAKEIGMNWGENFLNPGNPANATLGRAMRLMLINLGNFTPPNMVTSQGHPANYSCCFAENIWDSPWESLSEEYGFKPGESTISIFWSMNYINTFFVGVHRYRYHKLLLPLIPVQIKHAEEPGAFGVLLIPDMAKDLYERGFRTKQDVKKWVWENTTELWGERKIRQWGTKGPPWFRQAMAEQTGYRRWEDIPDHAIIHPLPRPENLSIIVAGDGDEFGMAMALRRLATAPIDKWR